ncbi:MAG TPA: porin, partial [Burkholderiales bacterium]
MQKKVLAAAIGACLIAPAAMAEVTISGRLAVGFESYEIDGMDSELRVSDQSSSLVFSGKEDLGGGLSAWFRIDNRFNPDANIPTGPSAGTSFGATGNTGVGLEGGFGRLTIGRWDLHYNEMFAYESLPSGSLQTRVTGSVFSQVGAGTPFDKIANNTRTPNVIMWDGSFGGGFSARVAYSTSGILPNATESSGEDEGDVITAALRWSNGPLSLGA